MIEDIIEVNPACKLNFLFSNLTISNDLVKRIKIAQERDKELQGFIFSLNSIKKGENKMLRFEGRLCVRKNEELTSDILHKVHHSKYTIHPGITKMY